MGNQNESPFRAELARLHRLTRNLDRQRDRIPPELELLTVDCLTCLAAFGGEVVRWSMDQLIGPNAPKYTCHTSTLDNVKKVLHATRLLARAEKVLKKPSDTTPEDSAQYAAQGGRKRGPKERNHQQVVDIIGTTDKRRLEDDKFLLAACKKLETAKVAAPRKWIRWGSTTYDWVGAYYLKRENVRKSLQGSIDIVVRRTEIS